ncbi:MAG: response regulator, partial [Planctomycetota bacterium]
MATVLVVDDKDMMRDSVCETLRRAGFEVRGVGDGASALESAGRQRPDAVVTDLKMPGMTGIELVEKLQRLDPDLPVIVMTAFGTIETAVRAMRLGAFDYVTKPFEGDELIISLKRGLQHARLLRENAVLRSGGGRSSGQSGVPDGGGRGLERLIGESAAMRKVREQVSAVAGSNGTVLVTGESGTGKEVVAQAIHDLSDRAGGPFLAVNCTVPFEPATAETCSRTF